MMHLRPPITISVGNINWLLGIVSDIVTAAFNKRRHIKYAVDTNHVNLFKWNKKGDNNNLMGYDQYRNNLYYNNDGSYKNTELCKCNNFKKKKNPGDTIFIVYIVMRKETTVKYSFMYRREFPEIYNNLGNSFFFFFFFMLPTDCKHDQLFSHFLFLHNT